MKSDEQFRRAVYEKRDAAAAKRKTRRRRGAAVVAPLAVCLLCGWIYLSLPAHSRVQSADSAPFSSTAPGEDFSPEAAPNTQTTLPPYGQPPQAGASSVSVRAETIGGDPVYLGGPHDAEIAALLLQLTPHRFPDGESPPAGAYQIFVEKGGAYLCYLYDGTYFFYEHDMGWMALEGPTAAQLRSLLGLPPAP